MPFPALEKGCEQICYVALYHLLLYFTFELLLICMLFFKPVYKPDPSLCGFRRSRLLLSDVLCFPGGWNGCCEGFSLLPPHLLVIG